MPAQAKRVSIPFANQYGERAAKTVSTERLVNWYADKVETHGKPRFVLQQRPGLNTVSTIGTGRIADRWSMRESCISFPAAVSIR